MVKKDEVAVSKQYSFEGWNGIEWVKGNLKIIKNNWDTIKEGIKFVVPFVLGLAIFKDNPALIGIITILGKGVIDALEFYFSEVKL